MSWNWRQARMRKLWNLGDSSLTDIASAVALPVDEVEAYLKRQPGYPDVVGARLVICQAPQCGQEFGATHGATKYCSAKCRRAGDNRKARDYQRRKRGFVHRDEVEVLGG